MGYASFLDAGPWSVHATMPTSNTNTLTWTEDHRIAAVWLSGSRRTFSFERNSDLHPTVAPPRQQLMPPALFYPRRCSLLCSSSEAARGAFSCGARRPRLKNPVSIDFRVAVPLWACTVWKFPCSASVKATLLLPNGAQSQPNREEPQRSGCRHASAVMDGPHSGDDG